MQTKNKSREDLEAQTKEFLKKKTDDRWIEQSTADEILKNLDIEWNFWLWLKEETKSRLDLYDKKEIEKHLYQTQKRRKIMTKEELGDFWYVWKQYISHIKDERKNILVKKISEPYNIQSKKIREYIKINLGNKENIEKIVWLCEHFPEQEFVEQFINTNYKGCNIEYIDRELINFCRQFENISKWSINTIVETLKQWYDVDMLKLLAKEFDIHSLDFFSDDEIQDFFKNNQGADTDIVAQNIQVCKQRGISDIHKIIAPILANGNKKSLVMYPHLQDYFSLLIDNSWINDPIQVYEYLIEIIELDYKKLIEWLDIPASIHYEGNGGNTSEEIDMFGWDWNNNDNKLTKTKISEIFWWVSEDKVNMLKTLRTDKWMKNRKKNLNFAKDAWILSSTKILEYGNRIDPQRNRKIGALKTIPYEELKETLNTIKSLGTDKKNIKEFGVLLLWRWDVIESSKILNILINIIWIKDYKRIIKADSDMRSEDQDPIKQILDYQTGPEILEKNIQIIKSLDINTPEDLLKYTGKLCNAKPENLQIIINAGINNINDLATLKEVAQESKPENLQTIIDAWVKNTDNLVKLEKLLSIIDNKDLQGKITILEKNDISGPENLIKLKDILTYGKKENLEYIIDHVTKDIDKLITLEPIMKTAQKDNLEYIIEHVTKDIDKLIVLEPVMKTAQKDNLEYIIEHVTKDIDKLITLGLVISISQKENLKYIIKHVTKDIDKLITLKRVMKTATTENIKIVVDIWINDIESLIILEDILEKYKSNYLEKLITLFTDNNLSTQEKVIYLWNLTPLYKRDIEYVKEFVKNIKKNKKWFFYGYFSEAVKNGIKVDNNTINTTNFLDYMDENIPLLIFEQDGPLKPGEKKPWTKDWFWEYPERKEYLKPEIMETFKKFWTIIWLGILEGAKNSKNLKKFYNYIFENISLEDSRTSILQLWEVFNVILKKKTYDILDEIVEKEENIGEEFKKFIEEHKISDKWKTILTLMITRGINQSFAIGKDKKTNTTDIKKMLLWVFDKFKRYKKIIDQYQKIPIKTSIGIEYEDTSNIAIGYYQEVKGHENTENEEAIINKARIKYKSDIETLSAYSGISKWNDAVHEIATKPTDNPYLLLLELKLLEDLDFMDINFKKEGYKKGWRTIHITLGWEYGIIYDKNANFIQNILNVSNLWWINLWEDVQKINNYSNIRDKGTDCETLFWEKKTVCTEYRALDINKAEQVERVLLSIFNLNTAKQVIDKYINKEFVNTLQENSDIYENLDSIEQLKKYIDKKNILVEEIKDQEIYTRLYEFLRLQKDILGIITNHNINFMKNEISEKEYTPALIELLHLAGNTWSQMLIYMETVDMDPIYFGGLTHKEILTQKDFITQTRLDGKKIDKLNEQQKKILYMWYKKRFEPILRKLEKENPKVYQRLGDYILNNDIRELERKRRNKERLEDEAKKAWITREEYIESIKVNKNGFFETITPKLVNTFTHINNFFLKQDSTNASSMFDTTIEENGEIVESHQSAETTIFDKLDQGISARNWYNHIQWASEKMITQAIQKRILEFNDKIFESLSTHKKTVNMSTNDDRRLAA